MTVSMKMAAFALQRLTNGEGLEHDLHNNQHYMRFHYMEFEVRNHTVTLKFLDKNRKQLCELSEPISTQDTCSMQIQGRIPIELSK